MRVQGLAAIAFPLYELPPTDLAPPTPAPVDARRRPITCEFCQCRLAPDGSVMGMSDTARTFRDQNEQIAALKRELEAEQTAHRQTTEKLNALSSEPAPSNGRQFRL